jgi:hypothetical protein
MNFNDIMLLENKAQYAAMIQPLVALEVITASDAQEVLKFARNNLKRNDRIVWWLKWYRILKLTSRISWANDPEAPSVIKMQKMLDKVTKVTGSTNPGQRDTRAFNSDFGRVGGSNLNHYISMMNRVPSMDNIVWDASLTPGDLKAALDNKEEEWKKAAKQEIDIDQYDEPEYAGRSPWEKVIDYGAQAWVLIDKDYCDLEGAAMGHCGNDQRGQRGMRILSFRTIVNEKRHKPHLTFIIDQEGALGEMKGRGNEKPAQKYHKVIIDLLLSDMVTRIRGGGHEPGKNFSFNDLDETQQEAIINQKPALAPLIYKVNKGTAKVEDFGEMSDLFVEAAIVSGNNFLVNLETKTITLDAFSEIDDIVDWAIHFNFGNIKYMAQTVEEGYIEQNEYGRADDDDLEAILDGLDKNSHLALEKYVEQNMPDPEEEEEEEEEEEYSSDNLLRIIRENDNFDDVYEAFESAYRDAVDAGSFDDLYEQFISAIKHNGISYDQSSNHYVWNTPMSNALDLFRELTDEEHYEARDAAREELQIRDADEARYGYYGFSAEVGSDRLADQLLEVDGFKEVYDQITSQNNESIDRIKTLAGI